VDGHKSFNSDITAISILFRLILSNQNPIKAMKIKKIGYNGIRGLKFTPIQITSDLFFDDVKSGMQEIEVTDVNILVGLNGAGKSSIIDIIHSLRKTIMLGTLPRDNPPKDVYPAFNIEFFDGREILALFSTSIYEDVKTKKPSMVSCQIFFRPMRLAPFIPVYSGNLFKEKFESIEYTDLPLFKGIRINFKDCSDTDKIPTAIHISELNKVRLFLPNLARQKGFRELKLLEKPFMFNEEEPDTVHIYIAGDSSMFNSFSYSLLPSGWKSYASTVSWLINCKKDSICLLEEPEIHLHPTLQRLLIKRALDIVEDKGIQLFISTHSQVIINSRELKACSYFKGCKGIVEKANDLHSVCAELGNKPSDLLQSTCIIWVEGPSDIIYLRYWLEEKAPDLIEGVDYTLMWYGGNCFYHMSAANEIPSEALISVANINRNMAIVFDSDKDNPNKELSDTKLRLQDEIQGNGGFVWVTEGREIENYLDEEALEIIVLSQHTSARGLLNNGKWDNLLKFESQSSGKIISANKVKVANEYVSSVTPALDKYDLSIKLDRLVEFIQNSNQEFFAE
jgi:AAA15 family ATPase/GTPase